MIIRKTINDYAGKIPLIGNTLTKEVKPKDLLVTGMLSTYLITPAKATAGSFAEVLATKDNATLDTKILGDMGKFGLLLRNRVTSNYDGSTNHFTLGDVSYPIAKGIDGVIEFQTAPEMGTVPRIAVQYFKQFGNKSVYLFGSRSLSGHDAEVIALLKYTPNIKGDVKGLFQLETVSNFDTQKCNFNVFRLRTGLNVKGYNFGVGLDAVKANGQKVKHGLGFFASKGF